jgi:hypothetical protein
VKIALAALAVLAIILPTALIPETASAHGNVYSVDQVLHVFASHGLTLQRIPREGRGSFETLTASAAANDFQFDADVYPPGSRPARHDVDRVEFASIVSAARPDRPVPRSRCSGSTDRRNAGTLLLRGCGPGADAHTLPPFERRYANSATRRQTRRALPNRRSSSTRDSRARSTPPASPAALWRSTATTPARERGGS